MAGINLKISKFPILNHFQTFRWMLGGYWTKVNGLMWAYWVKTSWIPCKKFRISTWEDHSE